MEIHCLASDGIDAEAGLQLAVLLSRAYTDERHARAWQGERAAAWLPQVARVRVAHPLDGVVMPDSFLAQFPTLRNARRAPEARRASLHFITHEGGYLSTHVSLWAQRFDFEGEALVGGYIEDVATDPLHLGRGLAAAAMRAARAEAEARGLEVLGLATGIPPFYERLGWSTWKGSHAMTSGEHTFPDEPLMLLPLGERGAWLARQAGGMRSERHMRFGG